MYHQLWESAKGKSFGPSKGGSVYNLSNSEALLGTPGGLNMQL